MSHAVVLLANETGTYVGDVGITAGASGLGKAEDSVHGSGDIGVMVLAVRQDALAVLAANGDYIPLVVDASGRLYTLAAIGTGATDAGKAVDGAAGATDTGIAALVVRDDALAALTPADGDYTHFRVDSTGSLWSRISAVPADPFGANADAASGAGAAGSISAKLRQLSSDLDAVKTAIQAQLAVGGTTVQRQVSVTIAAAAYAAGDCVGGAGTISNLTRAASKGGVLKSLQVAVNRSITPALKVFLRPGSFVKSPADNATMTAAAAASFSTTDLPNILGPFSIAAADWVPAGANNFASIDLAKAIPPSTSATAFQYLVKSDTAIASAAGGSFELGFEMLQD